MAPRRPRRGPPPEPVPTRLRHLPPRFAGRHHLIAEVLGRVERGPGRHDFHSVLIGPRGVGKTVLLAEVLHQGREPQPLGDDPLERQPPAAPSTRRTARRCGTPVAGRAAPSAPRLDGGVDLKVAPAGVGAEARVRVGSGAQRASSAYGMSGSFGQLGARRHGVVIIAADELQAASTEDLQTDRRHPAARQRARAVGLSHRCGPASDRAPAAQRPGQSRLRRTAGSHPASRTSTPQPPVTPSRPRSTTPVETSTPPPSSCSSPPQAATRTPSSSPGTPAGKPPATPATSPPPTPARRHDTSTAPSTPRSTNRAGTP